MNLKFWQSTSKAPAPTAKAVQAPIMGFLQDLRDAPDGDLLLAVVIEEGTTKFRVAWKTPEGWRDSWTDGIISPTATDPNYRGTPAGWLIPLTEGEGKAWTRV